MNKKQEQVVEKIRRDAFKAFDYGHNGTYEYKRFEVEDLGYSVSVTAEVGMIGDEGTWGEVLCRDCIHLFIGSRGGITYYKWTGTKCVKKRFKSYLRVSLDQSINY